ncbi:hypothetical protein [Endozoicomonas arenosclerae]|uniref:hypothetical protein n=1 Tax=Endozoicomonas arenosclerae TaxID=1633495 RepID=UPI0007835AFB|nr:hypothetical protein [Endozoicomonas arenosclerae]
MKRTSYFLIQIFAGLFLTQLVVAQPQLMSSFSFAQVGQYASAVPDIYTKNSCISSGDSGLIYPCQIQEERLFPLSKEWEELKQKWLSGLFFAPPKHIDLKPKPISPAQWPRHNIDIKMRPDKFTELPISEHLRDRFVAVDLAFLKDGFESEFNWSEQNPEEGMDQMLLLFYMKSAGIVSTSIRGQQYFLWSNGGQAIYLTREELHQMYLRWLRITKEQAFERLLEWWERFGHTARVYTGGNGKEKRNPKRPSKLEVDPDDKSKVKRHKPLEPKDSDTDKRGTIKSGAESVKKVAKKDGSRLVSAVVKGKEVARILKVARRKKLSNDAIIHFHTRIWEKISHIMANALLQWGNTLADLNSTGDILPPETGQQLGINIRDMPGNSLQAQYMARMFRYFMKIRLPQERRENHELLVKYQNAFVELLQYIALDQANWFLSEELIQNWLAYEDMEWIKMFADFPTQAEWDQDEWKDQYKGDDLSPIILQFSDVTEGVPELLAGTGPSLREELQYYVSYIEGVAMDKESEDEVFYFNFTPIREPCFAVSLYFTLTLLAYEGTYRLTLLRWMKGIDSYFQVSTDFFQYVEKKYHQLMFFTLPSYNEDFDPHEFLDEKLKIEMTEEHEQFED